MTALSWQKRAYGYAIPEAELRLESKLTPEGHVGGSGSNPAITQAILSGEQKYTDLRAPVLAIFAVPKDPGPYANANNSSASLAAAEDRDMATMGAQAKAFEAGVPSARVVRLAHASHYVFLSNEADVLREMHAFIDSLH